MTYLSILEKLKVLFNTLIDYKIILIFSGLLTLLTFLYTIKKISSKKYAKCIVLSLIIALLISVLDNIKELSSTFNNFTTIFFKNIYFPSIYVYLSIIVIVLISTIVTLLNKNTKKVYKVINSLTFILNTILFILILNLIAKYKIDVFSVNSLYTNTPLVVTLEISTGLFLLWLGLLLISYITNCIVERIPSKHTKEVLPVKTINIDNNKVKEEYNQIIQNKKPVEIVNKPVTVSMINYVHIPTEENIKLANEHTDNISFQDILERITRTEKINNDIEYANLFTDQQYNLIFKEI